VRLSELLACRVYDENGECAGHVHDVRLVQDGPVGAGFDAAIRVQGLVLGQRGIASRLGYGRSRVTGPWLVRVVVTAGRRCSFVPWERVRSIAPHRIEISGTRNDLDELQSLSERGTEHVS
jgi:sporulation protein YlmC with PRC-barrel domain